MKTFNLYKQGLLQLMFLLAISLFLTLYLLYCISFKNEFNEVFGFYFDGSFRDFKKWFPSFYLPAFVFVKFLKIGFFVVLFYFFYKIYSIRDKLTLYFQITYETEFRRIIINNLLLFFCYLTFCLVLYFNFESFDFTKPYYFSINQLIARIFVLNICFQLLTLIFCNQSLVTEKLKIFFFEPKTPYTISVLRILFFSYLILIYLFKLVLIPPTVDLHSKVSLPFINWLVTNLPVNSSIYFVVAIIGIASCVFIVFGFKTRFFLIVNSISVFYIVATPNFFGKLWHEQIIIWISWFFVFSRCFDVYSIDSKLNKSIIVKSPDYNYPVKFVWITFGVIYFWAGFYKLWDGGFDWAFSDSMINQIQLEWAQHYNKIPKIRIDNYPNLLHILGMVVILFEMIFIFLLFSKKWKWLAILGGLLMHNVLGYFMYISFFFLLQVFYIFFFDFSFFQNGKLERNTISNGFSKKAFILGFSIIILNFLFGMFNINSYPFSAYPSYSSIIHKDLQIIEFQCQNGKNNLEIGKQNNFRWEDYGWLEFNLIKDYQAGKNIHSKLNDYWEIWKNGNKQLCDCDTVKVNLLIRPLDPEKRNLIKKIETIDTLFLSNK